MSASGAEADRAWQLFHVNWLYFTGLAGGSVAITAVHKIAKAKWSGVVLRFAQAAVAFFPVSLLGLILIFTVGYEHIYGPMQEQLHALGHGKALWLSKPWMFGRLLVGLSALYYIGWQLIRADLLPDLADAREAAERTPAPAVRRHARRIRRHGGGPGGARGADPPPGADLRGHLRHGLHARGVRRHHGAAAALVLEPARRLLLHGLVPRGPHAAGAHRHVQQPPGRGVAPDLAPSSATTSASSASASRCSGPT